MFRLKINQISCDASVCLMNMRSKFTQFTRNFDSRLGKAWFMTNLSIVAHILFEHYFCQLAYSAHKSIIQRGQHITIQLDFIDFLFRWQIHLGTNQLTIIGKTRFWNGGLKIIRNKNGFFIIAKMFSIVSFFFYLRNIYDIKNYINKLKLKQAR